jgi:pimeloyl-ACP methyl ester carboxylesterase
VALVRADTLGSQDPLDIKENVMVGSETPVVFRSCRISDLDQVAARWSRINRELAPAGMEEIFEQYIATTISGELTHLPGDELGQYTVEVDSIVLHYIHVEGKGPAPMPLLLTHGWPSSFADFRRIIPLLTDPARFGGDPRDAFTVVAPSMPGHGFSFKPNQRRFSILEISDTLAKLMIDVLGYKTLGCQGGDWGAFVSSRLGYAYPRNVSGIQISLLTIPRERPAIGTPTMEENQFFELLGNWLREETGYIQIVGTTPQTLAYALSDSPVGLTTWILEKLSSWTDCNGDLDALLGRDVLATNIMLYWATGAIGSSYWPYYA